MSLRIHFTADDIARTRIVAEPDPMWELVLSVHQLQYRHVGDQYLVWREHALERTNVPACRRHLDVLISMNPGHGDFPDFLTPRVAGGGFPAALETVLTTPRQRLRAELRQHMRKHRASRRSAAVQAISDGRADGIRSLGRATTWYHDEVLAPYWPLVRQTVVDDHVVRAKHLSDNGPDKLLANIPGCTRWVRPVLHLDYPVERDLHLEGRGLTLIPSYFCSGKPVTLIDDHLPPVLVYPAAPWRRDIPAALIELLGSTRAHALSTLDRPLSTSALAALIGTSPSSASRHAKVLRSAGLITSTRREKAVIHQLTPLGTMLLNGQESASCRGIRKEA